MFYAVPIVEKSPVRFAFTFEGVWYTFKWLPMGYLNSTAITHNICCLDINTLQSENCHFWQYIDGIMQRDLWGSSTGRFAHLHTSCSPMWLANPPWQDPRPSFICHLSEHHLTLQGPRDPPSHQHQLFTIKPTILHYTQWAPHILGLFILWRQHTLHVSLIPCPWNHMHVCNLPLGQGPTVLFRSCK